MKTIKQSLFIILFTSFCVQIQAQKHYEIFSENLDTYTGTWKYQTDNEILSVYLKKGYLNTEIISGNYLIGDYSYTKNGIQIDTYDTKLIPDTLNENNHDLQIIKGANKTDYNGFPLSNLVYIVWQDKQYKKTLVGTMELISSTQIFLKLEIPEGEDESENLTENISIPNNITLTKVIKKIRK